MNTCTMVCSRISDMLLRCIRYGIVLAAGDALVGACVGVSTASSISRKAYFRSSSCANDR